MTPIDTFQQYDATSLPPVIVEYLAAQSEGTVPRIAATFVDDAQVTDEGNLYEGAQRIHEWLTRAASQYTYTTTLIGQRQEDPDTWVVTARLQGNFPGGVADLRYRFTVRDEKISRLIIAP